jgi:hypothetical protein
MDARTVPGLELVEGIKTRSIFVRRCTFRSAVHCLSLARCASRGLYGMYSHVYTLAELRQMVVSDPFDRSETPRQLKLTELTEWLEALVA